MFHELSTTSRQVLSTMIVWNDFVPWKKNGSFHIKYILPSSYLTWIPWEYPRILLRRFAVETLSHKHKHPRLCGSRGKLSAEAARSVIFASAPGQPSECCVSSFFLSRFWAEKNDNKQTAVLSTKFEVRLLEKLEPAASLSRFYGGIPVSIVPMVFFLVVWHHRKVDK